MLYCVISDWNWKNGNLDYRIEDKDGTALEFHHMVFMFYSKKDAIKRLKENIRQKYGDVKFKIEYSSTENTDKNAVKVYDLIPINQKSFYGKAKIHVYKNGDEVLQSYDTLIIRRKKSGKLIRLWDDWSATTGRHIKAFCGLNKAGYNKLPLAK